jgi:LacI family transcriptional regulator
MAAAGLEVSPLRVVNANFDDIVAYNLVWRLLQDDPGIDALFCASDLMAIGACRAIEDLGKRVGSDIFVVGFDDIPIAKYLYGGLTTVRQDFYRMGYVAGQAIYDRIEGTSKAHTDDVMYELVVRGSARAG